MNYYYIIGGIIAVAVALYFLKDKLGLEMPKMGGSDEEAEHFTNVQQPQQQQSQYTNQNQ